MEQTDKILLIVTNFWFLLIIAYLGMLIHFTKHKIRGESIKAMRDYFRDHFKTVTSAIILTFVGFIAYFVILATGQPADIFAVFSIGYLCDSSLNKYDEYKDNWIKKTYGENN